MLLQLVQSDLIYFILYDFIACSTIGLCGIYIYDQQYRFVLNACFLLSMLQI